MSGHVSWRTPSWRYGPVRFRSVVGHRRRLNLTRVPHPHQFVKYGQIVRYAAAGSVIADCYFGRPWEMREPTPTGCGPQPWSWKPDSLPSCSRMTTPTRSCEPGLTGMRTHFRGPTLIV